MILPEWINKYVSTPYEELDCWDLCQLVYQERYHIEIGNLKEQPELIKVGAWERIETDMMIDGDVMLFKADPRRPHVALALPKEFMMHSVKPIGVVIEKWTRRNWKDQLKAVYRHSKR